MTQRGRTTLGTRVVLTTVVVLGVAFAAPGTAQVAPPAQAVAAVRAAGCGEVDQAFRPTWVRIPDVVGQTPVLALGRDRNGVPRTPPLTDSGKWKFAWDRASGIRPGERYGVVRLNAHTYPRSGAYGSALGNRLLSRLHAGRRLVVSGRDGERLCYRVSRRVQVRPTATRAMMAYYSSTGPSRLAILVCSGRRRGPGDWSHRTIWFARPMTTS